MLWLRDHPDERPQFDRRWPQFGPFPADLPPKGSPAQNPAAPTSWPTERPTPRAPTRAVIAPPAIHHRPKPLMGFEPMTSALPRMRSTTELQRHTKIIPHRAGPKRVEMIAGICLEVVAARTCQALSPSFSRDPKPHLLFQLLDDQVELRLARAPILDRPHGVHHGRMVAPAKVPADFFERKPRVLAGQIHA